LRARGQEGRKEARGRTYLEMKETKSSILGRNKRTGKKEKNFIKWTRTLKFSLRKGVEGPLDVRIEERDDLEDAAALLEGIQDAKLLQRSI